MIRKHLAYNRPLDRAAPPESAELESAGHVLLRGVLDSSAVATLRAEVETVYATLPPDVRAGSRDPERAQMFRYELFNRSPRTQAALGHPRILATIEPLLGDDCHVIANTAWRNPPDRASAPEGQQWHVDGGPHVTRPAGVRWPEEIPYPVFVVTAQLYLQAVRLEDGPTAILPGSHRSGALPPHERMWDVHLDFEGNGAAVHEADAGDVTLFVSDTWHRRMPQGGHTRGRFFIQIIYGRREIAQRVVPTERCCAASPEARARARTLRERQLIGLHDQCFYDG